MTTSPATAPVDMGLAQRAARKVWRSWRAITPRDVGYVALAGIGLGLTEGMTRALYLRGSPWDELFLQGVLPMAILALCLLLCLSVAAATTNDGAYRWGPFVVAATIAVTIASALDALMWYFVLPLQGKAHPDAMQALLLNFVGALNKPWQLAVLAALAYMYALAARQRIDTLRKLQLDDVRETRLTYEARLQALQARVDPRYLFDTLASVEAAYAAGGPRGQQMLDALIQFLRSALPSLRQRSSSVLTEIALARAWMETTRLSHDDRLEFDIDVADPMPPARLPAMVLLPLVQHAAGAVTGSSSGRATIHLVVRCEGSRLRVHVRWSDEGAAPVARTTPLDAIRNHLESLYGSEASIASTTASGNGIDLEIPHEPPDRDPR